MAFPGIWSLFDGYNILLPLLLVVGVVLISQFFEPRMDPREPPLVRPVIPVIGHLVGLMRSQMEYYAILSRKSPYPNFTLPILSSKVYVVTSPLLAQVVLRHKDLDFTTFITGIGLRPIGTSKETIDKVRLDSSDHQKVSYLSEIHKAFYEKLGPGPTLDAMNAKMLSKVGETLNAIGDVFEVSELWTWLKKTFTLATTYSLYGEHDPFSADPSLYSALWNFDKSIGILLLGILPSVTARKGYRGRKAVQVAMEKYYKAGYDQSPDASGLVRGRGELFRKYGFSDRESGELEITLPWVSTTNAIPALYWTLCYVVSDPKLLEDLRCEVKNALTTIEDRACQTLTFNITKFNSEDCPLLLSTYQESIRLTNNQISIRMVEKDTVLNTANESILLKKGNVVQIPAGVTHTSVSTWGPNSDVFDARRFMKKAEDKKEQAKERRSAYIPFGGGKHLCPGRHFAQAEILGMVAAVITGFEVLDRDGGLVKPPRTSQVSTEFGQAMGRPIGPAEKVGVTLTRREGMAHVKFAFTV